MRKIFCIMLILSGLMAFAEDGNSILKKIDDNMYSESQIVESRMMIHGRRGSREIATRNWTRGSHDSFTEYLSPPREAGTKMLKLGDDLWMYEKNSDRIIQISGHLLRQSVNGSDLSYEDFMEETSYLERYDAEVIKEEVFEERECIVLLLKAKSEDITYSQQKFWVDKEYWIPLKQELFGSGGTLLKRVILSDVRRVNNRWYPFKIHYKDVLDKRGKGTDLVIDKIEFNMEIDENRFTKAKLRK